MKVVPLEDPITGEVEEVIPYSEYADDLEVGVIYNRIDAFMGDLAEDDHHIRIHVFRTLFSIIFCLLGIFLIILGGAITVAFQSQPKLIWLQVLGGLFQIPIILWSIYLCCPSKEERQRRHMIHKKRKLRDEMYKDKDDAKFIAMANTNIKIRNEEEELDKKSKIEREIAEKKANPLGYPKKPEQKTSERRATDRKF